jgi:exopolysaccharide production protein ExoQ
VYTPARRGLGGFQVRMEDNMNASMQRTQVPFSALTLLMILSLAFFAAESRLPGSSVAASATESSPATLAAMAINWMVVGLCISLRMSRLFSQCWKNKYIFAVPALALLSASWSQDPSRTMLKATCLLLLTVFAVSFVNRYGHEETMRIFYAVGVIVVAASLLLSVFAPGIGTQNGSYNGPWNGIFVTKNDAARGVLFLLPAALCYKPQSQLAVIARYCHISASLLFILLTRSVTGIAATFALLALFFASVILRRTAKVEKLLLVGGVLIAFAVIALFVYLNAAQILPLFGRDTSLTGRTKIWASVVLSIAKRPLLGYGHGAFWIGRGESMNTDVAANWDVSYAHDGYLDVLLQLGYAGLALVIYLLVKASFNLYRYLQKEISPYSIWCLATLLLTIFFNFDETTFLMEQRIYWVLFLLVSLSLNQREKFGISGLPAGQYGSA